MVSRIPRADDSESDWDSISQPIPATQPLPDQSATHFSVQEPPPGTRKYDEKEIKNYSSDQEIDATDSETVIDDPETARFAAGITTKREVNKRSPSNDSQNLPSLPYDQTRVSSRRHDKKSLCDLEERRLKSWDSGLVSTNGNRMKEQGSFQTDVLDIEIRSHNLIPTQPVIERKESYFLKTENWKLPSLNDRKSPEECVNISSKTFTKRDYSKAMNGVQEGMSQDRITKLPLSNGETEVHLTDELTEIFHYERCNVDLHEASEKSSKSFANTWLAKVLHISNRFWVEVTSAMETPFLFLLAFALQMIRFLTTGLMKPLIIGLFRGISDGLLKPVLCVLHNAFLVPAAVFAHNVGLALHTALLPVGSIIAIVTDALARLLQSFRLVEVHLHSDTAHERYTVDRDRRVDKTTLQRV